MAIVVISGAMANKRRNGGEAWVRLNWILGFQRLGFEVYFIEQIDSASCVSSDGVTTTFEVSDNLAYFKEVTEQFGLAGRAALICENGEIAGMSLPEILDVAERADLLVNISGHLRLERLMKRFRRKVYVDIDPGFTQFWHADSDVDFRVGGHDRYFTIGENIGTDGCTIPTGGIDWMRIRPPVVLDLWPFSNGSSSSSFTTIASWRGPFGPIQYDGQIFGLKVHEFRKFIELPSISSQDFEIALNIHPAEIEDLKLLRDNKWKLAAPMQVASDPITFREYVKKSKGEFSVAQGVYVDTNSGWFSDRTVEYLAAGKPVLIQDTGFSKNYPVGDGLVPFRTMAEAVTGAERIVQDYEKHCWAARTLAEEYFDSDKVLNKFLKEVDASLSERRSSSKLL